MSSEDLHVKGDESAETEGNEQKGQSDRDIIFSMTNNMVGGSLLIFPILFFESGVITSVLCCLVYAGVNYKSSKIYLQHFKVKEPDIQFSVLRILGYKYYIAFNVSSVLALFFLNMIYFYYLVDNLSKVIGFGIYQSGDHTFKFNQHAVIWDQFSLQYLSFICVLLVGPLLFVKNLGILVRLSAFGVIPVYALFLFYFYMLGDNIYLSHKHDYSIITSDLKVWTWKFGNIAGAASTAFSIQYFMGPIFKTGANQHHNVRNLQWSFLFGTIIYTVGGVIGMFAVSNFNKTPASEIDCLVSALDLYGSGDYRKLFIAIMFFFKFFSVFPICVAPMRLRILEMAFGKDDSPKKTLWSNIFNVFYLLCVLLPFLVPAIQPGMLLNITGSVCCFVFIYVVPLVMHLECYHNDHKVVNGEVHRQLVESVAEDGAYNRPDLSMQMIQHESDRSSNIYTPLHQDSGRLQSGDSETDNSSSGVYQAQSVKKRAANKDSCLDHEVTDMQRHSVRFRQYFYGVIGVLGVVTMVMGIYSLVLGFVKPPDCNNSG